jgi:hypothetical protein
VAAYLACEFRFQVGQANVVTPNGRRRSRRNAHTGNPDIGEMSMRADSVRRGAVSNSVLT